jgi:putative ABC transport system permease protein
MQARDVVGFESFNVVRLNSEQWRGNDYAAFKQEVLKNVNVEAVSNAWQAPFEAWYAPELRWDDKPLDVESTIHVAAVDWDYAKVFEMQVLEGRFLPENMLTGEDANEESRSKVINESAARMIGKQNVIGTRVYVGAHDKVGGLVVGVVKDFNIRSKIIDSNIPMLFEYNPMVQIATFVRISPHNRKATIDYIENVFKQFKQDVPFEYSFVNDDYMALYRADFRMSTILLFCSFMSIFISCMGMFSLVALMVTHRSKEISIRKINGATVRDIVKLFMREFSIVVFISFVLSTPVAWYVMNQWLMGFDYQTNIGSFIFVGVFAVIWILTMFTLLAQVHRAARHNPVDLLKYE